MKRLSILKMFVAVPLLSLLTIYQLLTSPDWYMILLIGLVIYYPIHQLGQGIGYHKLFAHRSFTPKSWYPYISTFFASISFYGDPLSSAMIHRLHHKYSDTLKDPHSPNKGRFHAYIGWIKSYEVDVKDSRIILDLLREYPWMIPYRKIEWAVPLLFHTLTYLINPLLFWTIMFACLLSIHNGLIVNAFSHDPGLKELNQATDNKFLGRYVNPIFLHKYHHDFGSLYDYSYNGIKDYWAIVIDKVLRK